MPDQHSYRSAVKWAFVMNWGNACPSALATFILAGILGPTDFGTVVMASAYVLFMQMILEQGLTAALIQRKDLRDDHLNSAFWAVLAVSLALTGLSILLSGWWAAVNRLPELGSVICVLSLSIPIQGLTVVQQAVLERKLDFKPLALRSTVSAVCGGFVGVIMAIGGFGVWALVGQQLCTAVMALALLWSLSDWRPRWAFCSRSARDLLGFSTATFLARLGAFAATRADALIMGVFLGPTAVGIFRLAARMMQLLLTMATRALQVVALPQYSKAQGDPVAFRAGVLSSIRASAVLTIPAMALLGVLSASVMELFGSKWSAAAGALSVLVISGMVHSISLFMGPVLQAQGRAFTRTGIVWLLVVVDVVCLLLVTISMMNASIGTQVLGIAAMRTTVMVLVAGPIQIFFILRYCGIELRSFVAVISPALIAAAAGATLAATVSSLGSMLELRSELVLLTAVIFGGAAIAALLLLLDPEVRRAASNWRGELTSPTS